MSQRQELVTRVRAPGLFMLVLASSIAAFAPARAQGRHPLSVNSSYSDVAAFFWYDLPGILHSDLAVPFGIGLAVLTFGLFKIVRAKRRMAKAERDYDQVRKEEFHRMSPGGVQLFSSWEEAEQARKRRHAVIDHSFGGVFAVFVGYGLTCVGCVMVVGALIAFSNRR